jgi:hypothetical protein
MVGINLKSLGKTAAKTAITKGGKGAMLGQAKIWESIARWVARGIQLIFGLIAAGLYGHRVDEDRKAGNSQSVAWVFALFIAGLSCITCIIFALPIIKFHRLFAVDFSLFILWIAVFGTFASIFLKRHDGDKYEGTSVTTMKMAVWVDFLNCLLWLTTGAYGCFRTFVGRQIDNQVDKLEKGINTKLDSGVSSLKNKAAVKAARLI